MKFPKPQRCPHCKVSLADPGVPEKYAAMAESFTLALSQDGEWICPVCTGRWPR